MIDGTGGIVMQCQRQRRTATDRRVPELGAIKHDPSERRRQHNRGRKDYGTPQMRPRRLARPQVRRRADKSRKLLRIKRIPRLIRRSEMRRDSQKPQ